MEASAAQGSQASSDAGESQGTEAQEGQQQQDSGFDFSQLSDQVGQINAGLDELRTFMQEGQYQDLPEGEQPDDPAEVDLSQIDPNDPAYDPEVAAKQLLNVLGEQQQKQIQEAIGPLQERLQEQTLKTEAAELAQDFPELEDPATADAVFKTAREWCDSVGLPGEFATNYQVVRAVYLMGRALEAHNAEGGQPDVPAASLEGATGANPGGSSTGVTVEDIFGSDRTRGLPF